MITIEVIKMYITIDKVLLSQKRTRYWLAKEANITYPTLKKLCDNKTVSIQFSVLERICKVLNCTPNDILSIEESTT